jgi:hypothetical protein
MTAKNIQSVVMRRVYYSYALSIFTQSVFWQGIFLGAAAILLARWLHVASILNNFMAVPVGSVPHYIYNSFAGAVAHGEVLTVLTLLVASGVAMSVGYRLTHVLVPRLLLLSRV